MDKHNSTVNTAVETALETMKAFCSIWFQQRNPERLKPYLAEEITFTGTGTAGLLNGQQQVFQYLKNDIEKTRSPFKLNYLYEYEQEIDDNVCTVITEQTVVQGAFEKRFRSVYVMKRQEGKWFICQLHVSDIPDPAIAGLKRMKIRQKELYIQEMQYSSTLSVSNLIEKVLANVTTGTAGTYIGEELPDIEAAGNRFHTWIHSMSQKAVMPENRQQIEKVWDTEHILADYEQGKNDYRLEYQRYTDNGEIIWCLTTAKSYQNPETGDIMLFMYSFDISDTKIMEMILQKGMESKYDYIADINMKKDLYRLLSWKDGEEMNIPLEGSFTKENEHVMARMIQSEEDREYTAKMMSYECMTEQLEKEAFYSFQIPMKDSAGETRIKRIQISYADRLLGRICLTREDVTEIIEKEQKQKENLAAALVAAEQANAAKTDFLSRMSHEIRTPMNAIIGMSTIAAQAIGDNEQVMDCISKIGISSRFLLSLINDILDMSRIESGKMLLVNEKIEMAEFLNNVNSICYSQACAKGVDFECIVSPMLDDYYIGDAMKLQQVLVNILSNAIKFTNDRGKVTFSAAPRRKSKNDAVLRFIINDTGIGMSQEFVPHIFEPFSQESTGTTALYGGTGLGLSISKSIVDMMDGSISVRSIPGIGSEFTVDVKLGISEEEKQRHYQKKAMMKFADLKTLVVDDDVAVCESTVAVLKEMDVIAEWVDSGRKAVERVRDLWKKKKHFDMILIDWKMPEMDGIETARQLRKIVGPEVTIIIMTAYDWIAIEHEAKIAGVNLLMSKPMMKSTLISAFSKALGDKEEEMQPQLETFDFGGSKVLLVEDHPLNLEIAQKLLRAKGIVVDTAENGLRAIELFSKSREHEYDAILMDIRMPIMDGLTACSNIRHMSNPDAATIPIIAMTANAFDDDIEKSRKAGMNAHLAKPIEPQKLYRTLYDFIYGKGNEEKGLN